MIDGGWEFLREDGGGVCGNVVNLIFDFDPRKHFICPNREGVSLGHLRDPKNTFEDAT